MDRRPSYQRFISLLGATNPYPLEGRNVGARGGRSKGTARGSVGPGEPTAGRGDRQSPRGTPLITCAMGNAAPPTAAPPPSTVKLSDSLCAPHYAASLKCTHFSLYIALSLALLHFPRASAVSLSVHPACLYLPLVLMTPHDFLLCYEGFSPLDSGDCSCLCLNHPLRSGRGPIRSSRW